MTVAVRIEELVAAVAGLTAEDERRLRDALAEKAKARATARRDQLIREAVSRFRPSLSKSAQARWLHTALGRYYAGAWRRERMSQCPQCRIGKPEEMFHAMLKIRDAKPLCVRQIRRILMDIAAG